MNRWKRPALALALTVLAGTATMLGLGALDRAFPPPLDPPSTSVEVVDRDGALLRLTVLGTLFALALIVIGGGEVARGLLNVLGVGGGGLLVLLTARREGSRVEAAFREGVDAWVAQSLQAWGPDAERPAKVDRRRRSV